MSSAVDLKTKEEKDAELDRRIEALRKKNEALVKRYQEIEEDKKKAEQEGIAVTTPRKPRPHEPETDRRRTEKENFTVTVDVSKPAGEKRVINDWKPGTPRGRKTSEESEGPRGPSDGHSPPRRTGSGRLSWGSQRGGGGGGGGRQERRDREPRTPREGESGDSGGQQGRRGGRRARGGGGGGGRGGGRGRGEEEEGTPGGMDRKSKEWEEKRRQNIEKMNEEMEKIAEYERGQRHDGDKPIRNFLDDPRRSGPAPDIDRKEGSRRHVRNWGGLDFDNVKTGSELEREWTSRRPGPKGSVDMTMSMTGRERAEYLRWKKEREQIDEERLARHRNATGQWRREWDAQKTESMFKEDPYAAPEGITPEPGSRRAWGRNSRTEPRGRASVTRCATLKTDDSKRPPKVPTFGDFLSQGRSQGSRGDRRGGRGRGQKQSYSMHDNRWEGEKEEEEEEEEEEKQKDDKIKREEKTKKKKEEEEKPKQPMRQKVEEKNGDGAGDDDEGWEDASDGEEEEEVAEEGIYSEHDPRDDEKKDTGKEKRGKSKDGSPALSKPRSRTTSAGSPKEQRTPRPKVHIPPPTAVQESPEGGKPLSPFLPLDGHQPVTDWGEEMEMLSPRSSMGGESPLKPSSTESSPPQKKDREEEKEEESRAASSNKPTEPQKEEHAATDVSSLSEKTQPTLTESEAEAEVVTTEPPAAVPSDPAPSAPSDTDASEVSEAAVIMAQDAPAAPPQGDEPDSRPSPAVVEAEQSRSEPAAAEKDDDPAPAGTDAAPAAESVQSSEQTSSEQTSSEQTSSEQTSSEQTSSEQTGDEPDSRPSPAVVEAEQSRSEPAAAEKDDDPAPAGTDAAPAAEAVQSSEQTSSEQTSSEQTSSG
ncbi:coiled-coil domain-containing protein 9 [Odontesthes bonariensis]|uniref:coiled-coil domain-containing protein 9 n=1 Tax=Odontesthes bonariensis TaxID=219752 RepID=UPI003F5809F5